MGRQTSLAHVALVLAALAVTAMEAPAFAQVPGEEIARHAFEDGVTLEKKGDYSGALAKFKESSQIKATLGNRYHKAYCLEMTGKLAAALIEYETVDKTAREQNKADLLDATRVRLEPLRKRVPQLSLRMTSPPRDAEVSLDGTAVSPALLDGKAFRIDPGEHTITARAPEHESFTKQLTAAEGATLSLDVVLQPKPASVPAAKPTPAGTGGSSVGGQISEPPAEGPRSGPRTLAIVTSAGAVALAAGGVVAFVLAGSEKSDAEKACPTKPTCEDEKSTVRTLDALALGGFIGGAGLAALSVVLWTSKPTSAASTSPKIVGRPSWVGLEGRF